MINYCIFALEFSRGQWVPSFISCILKMDQGKVEEIVKQAVAEQGAFLVSFKLSDSNAIFIEADHAEGLSMKMITAISRYVEGSFDREVEDFSLEVASPGVGSPLLVKEQYVKNVGRDAKVKLEDGEELKGTITAFADDKVTLVWKKREPKPVGKGKITVEHSREIPLDEIKETRIQVSF